MLGSCRGHVDLVEECITVVSYFSCQYGIVERIGLWVLHQRDDIPHVRPIYIRVPLCQMMFPHARSLSLGADTALKGIAGAV